MNSILQYREIFLQICLNLAVISGIITYTVLEFDELHTQWSTLKNRPRIGQELSKYLRKH